MIKYTSISRKFPSELGVILCTAILSVGVIGLAVYNQTKERQEFNNKYKNISYLTQKDFIKAHVPQKLDLKDYVMEK